MFGPSRVLYPDQSKSSLACHMKVVEYHTWAEISAVANNDGLPLYPLGPRRCCYVESTSLTQQRRVTSGIKINMAGHSINLRTRYFSLSAPAILCMSAEV